MPFLFVVQRRRTPSVLGERPVQDIVYLARGIRRSPVSACVPPNILPAWNKVFLGSSALNHIGRAVLWQVKIESTHGLVLRLAEDNTLSDVRDEPIPFEAISTAEFGELAPATLSAAEVETWRDPLTRYELDRLLGFVNHSQAVS